MNGKDSIAAAEARAAAAAVQDKIAATKDDPRTHDDYFTFLSDLDVPGTEWMVDLADVLEESLIETVGDLARLDVNNEELALKLTRARSYGVARRTVWSWKRAAAALLEVELDKEVPPPIPPIPPMQTERPREHQRVPDGVANRFVAWLIGRFSHRSSIRLIAG